MRQRRENPQAMSNAELTKALAEMTPAVLMDAVDEILLLQRGKELGYKLTDDKFKSILDNIKKENKIETEEQFQAALKSEGMTMAELRKQLEKSMIVQQVQGNEVFGRISITEAEAKAYFEAHRTEFMTPATMMLREILVTVPVSKGQTFSVGLDEAAKAKADALQARAKAGENFEKLVTEASEAPSKANGGLIGPISLPDLDPSLRAIFEPLKQGDITEVIRTSGGYQIFKVDTADPGRGAAVGAGARGDRQPGGADEAERRVREVHGEDARAGGHRVEERRAEEDVRRRGGEGRSADGARPAKRECRPRPRRPKK